MTEENKFIGYCPGCGIPIYDDSWHLDDGRCADGNFYCMKRECPCGCVLEKRKKEEENQSKKTKEDTPITCENGHGDVYRGFCYNCEEEVEEKENG